MSGQTSDRPPPGDERRLRNLRAVARHLAAREDQPSGPADGGADSRSDGVASAGGAWDARPSSAPRTERERLPGKFAAWRRWGPLGLVLVFVLGKAKLVLPLLKFAKLGTLVSMLVAVWAYALFWGLPFAIGFVLLIFVHELGHALVLRHQGIRAGAPVFIPFVGAVIAMKGVPRNAYVEALVAIGGPVLGSVGALVCLLVGWFTGSLFWWALASTGFLINLFNLLPVSPLDGGRIVGVVSRWLWAVGYAVGIAIFLVTKHPLLFLILLVGLFTLVRTIRGPREGYFDVSPGKRAAMGAAYFGLAGILALLMWVSDERLRALDL